MQRIIHDQADEVPSTGMSACQACVLEEKLNCLKEIKQGKYSIVRISWSDDRQEIHEFDSKKPHDKLEYSSAFGWQKPGRDLGKPVCRVPNLS